MSIRPIHAPMLFMLAIAGAFASIAHAAEPPVLGQTGTVRGLTETHGGPCDGHAGGGADEFKHWKLERNKTKIKINTNSNKTRYVDVRWRWPHELQDPDFYIVNKHKAPIPVDVCQPSGLKVEDSLFLFAVHNLKNPESKGQPKSPHALVYVPMHTAANGNWSLGDKFYLFIFDIASDSTECADEKDGNPKDRCLALRRVFVKNAAYIEKEITEADLVAAIQREIGTIIPPAAAVADQAVRKADKELRPFLHNGIIHGTLGGG